MNNAVTIVINQYLKSMIHHFYHNLVVYRCVWHHELCLLCTLCFVSVFIWLILGHNIVHTSIAQVPEPIHKATLHHVILASVQSLGNAQTQWSQNSDHNYTELWNFTVIWKNNFSLKNLAFSKDFTSSIFQLKQTPVHSKNSFSNLNQHQLQK